MSDEQEQERDAAVIARYREALVWIMREESGETVSLKTANRSREIFDGRHRDFTDAALRTIDRLSAERDAAHEKIVSFGSTMADLIMLRSENERLEAETVEYAAILEKAVKESKAIVAGYNKAIAERDAARANEARWRERINAIIAIAESYECLAQNPDVETSVSQERLGFAQDIYQALGIESEASE